MPKVSVIIPTYNHRKFIAIALDSVLQQTYQDFEVIVADDSSTDGTSDLVRQYASAYPDKVRAVIGETRVGIAGNFNRALQLAQGEYVAWLGGDDLMHPTKLEQQVAFLDGEPTITGVHHDAEILDESSHMIVGLFSELFSRGVRRLVTGGIEILFRPGVCMLPSTMMVRRNAMPVHGFDERLRYTNDWLFDIETFRNGKIAAINKVLGVYRRHGGNVTSSRDLRSRALEENLIVLGIAQARYPELSLLIRRRRVAALIVEMIKRIQARDHATAYTVMKAAALEGGYLKAPILFACIRLLGRLAEKFDVKAYRNRRLVQLIRNLIRV